MPPTNVPIPVIPPRIIGLPRPVSSPVSESPSENAIEMPAPIAVATPAMKASNGLCVWSAIAKIGARVDSEPSMRPLSAGWTRWRRKARSAGALAPARRFRSWWVWSRINAAKKYPGRRQVERVRSRAL